MEENASSINPLLLFWQSAKVRGHVISAARELVLAAHAGLGELQTQAVQSGLTEQYPYLHAALGNLQSTVGQWVDTDTTTSASPKGGQRAACAASLRTTRKKVQKNRHGTRRSNK